MDDKKSDIIASGKINVSSTNAKIKQVGDSQCLNLDTEISDGVVYKRIKILDWERLMETFYISDIEICDGKIQIWKKCLGSNISVASFLDLSQLQD